MTHVDAHVHLYDGFDMGDIVAHGQAIARDTNAPFVCLLTEVAGWNMFSDFRAAAEVGGKPLMETKEADSVRVDETDPIVFVAGRQVVSNERIEVLYMGLDPAVSAPEDGTQTAESLIRWGLEHARLVCLPWSVGKWVGARGRLVEALVTGDTFKGERRLLLGDIRARSWPWRTPPVFENRRVLAGSDPLPLSGEESIIGTYRTAVAADVDLDHPAETLLGAIANGADVTTVGQRAGFMTTLRTQIRLRTSGALS